MRDIHQKWCVTLLFSLLCCVVVNGNDKTEGTNRKYDSDVTNRCPQPSEDVPIPNAHYYTHPRNCRKFVSCSYGLPQVLDCPEKTVFNAEVVACVHEDGPLNRGIDCDEKEPFDDLCDGNEKKLIPNPEVCQRYYDCSDNSSRYYSFLEPFEQECDYPDLFDHIDLKCVDWREARCLPGAQAGVQPCDYVRNQCVAAHCEPCYSRSPSCLGKPDGLNEHPTKLWTPHHVRCEANRSLEGLWCPEDPAGTPFRMIFSPRERRCVTVWEVPRQFNGFQPSCEKKDDGSYHVTAESDRVAYRCPGAQLFFCEEGEMFSTEEQTCITLEPWSTTPDSHTTGEVTAQPETEQPGTEPSLTEQPEQPLTEQPQTEQPETEQPRTEQPETEQPRTEQPETEQPQTEQPETEQPLTEEPLKDRPTIATLFPKLKINT